MMEIYTSNSEIDHVENLIEHPNQVVSHVVLKKGAEVPLHKGPEKFSGIAVVFKGKVLFSDGTRDVEVTPGMIVQISPGDMHALRALEDSEIIVVKSVLAK